MSFPFLGPGAPDGPVAHSPMEHAARAAGARFAVVDGWNVATGYDAPGDAAVVSWADASHLGVVELQVPPGDAATLTAEVEVLTGETLGLGRALRSAGTWWCPVTPERVLVLADPGLGFPLLTFAQMCTAEEATSISVLDLTTAFAGLVVEGPAARETIARVCALDLRPRITPVAGFRPGSVARTPGFVLREDTDRYLLLVGAAFGHSLWTVVADAGAHLGGAPVPYAPPPKEGASHA